MARLRISIVEARQAVQAIVRQLERQARRVDSVVPLGCSLSACLTVAGLSGLAENCQQQAVRLLRNGLPCGKLPLWHSRAIGRSPATLSTLEAMPLVPDGAAFRRILPPTGSVTGMVTAPAGTLQVGSQYRFLACIHLRQCQL